MRSALVWVLLLSLVDCGLCARILAVLPFPGKSHYIFYSSVLKALAQRGHQVVEYGPFPPKEPIPNYTHVEVHTSFENTINKFTYEDFKKPDQFSTVGLGFFGIWSFLYNVCDETFQSENIKKLIQSKEHFDLVITTSTFGQESMVAFGHKFHAPTVTIQGFTSSPFLNREAGNDLSIASIPESMSFPFTNQMTFIERLRNFLSVTMTLILYYSYHLPKQDSIVKKHMPPSTPYLGDMVTNISLTLINLHPAVGYPQPLTPNIIPVAGIQILPERKPLPQDIKKFMDDAKEGVIYFSLGTVVPAHTLPKKALETFINVFKKLPQMVLWKIDADSLPGLSKNIKLVKWVPQVGVLEHQNCAVFITHGGAFSQQEAIHAGVPTIGIPFFADQYSNMRFNELHGIGVKLDFNNLTEETFYSALNVVLNNPKFREKAKRLSRIYRDRPLSPSDTAVFWVEYVLRHKGAHHLRSAAAQLPWYQLILLDILAAILAVLVIVFITLYLVAKKIMSLLCEKNKTNKLPKGKKKN